MAFSNRRPSLLTASFERSNGVLSSMHFPKCVTKLQGMRKTLSQTNMGEDLSQVVNAAAVCVARKPPFGKEEPSVSPKNMRSYGRVALKGFEASCDDHSRSINVSILKAPQTPPTAPPPPRIGKNQWAKATAPNPRAHKNTAAAMAFISSSLVAAPVTKLSLNLLYTALLKLAFIVLSSNTALEERTSSSSAALEENISKNACEKLGDKK
mmetsp:Transcript_3958/g.6474  ORF Transcript_3958/g.6474 Transcript_3958/m.6474 type:complete len:210 (-) Transcript_3958:22-651(-)